MRTLKNVVIAFRISVRLQDTVFLIMITISVSNGFLCWKKKSVGNSCGVRSINELWRKRNQQANLIWAEKPNRIKAIFWKRMGF